MGINELLDLGLVNQGDFNDLRSSAAFGDQMAVAILSRLERVEDESNSQGQDYQVERERQEAWIREQQYYQWLNDQRLREGI